MRAHLDAALHSVRVRRDAAPAQPDAGRLVAPRSRQEEDEQLAAALALSMEFLLDVEAQPA